MGFSLEEKVWSCFEAAQAKKAQELLALDLKNLSSVTDCFIICHGTSGRQVRAIADVISETLAEKGIAPLSIEGYKEGRWILMDYGEMVVHIFTEEVRRFYDLEHLWGQAPPLPLDEERTSHHG
ncbi:MAG: ribosome silencing factor [Nitrospinota bacterium]